MSIPTFSQVHQVPTTAWRILCSVYGVCLSFCVRVASGALSSHISGLIGQHISYHWHLNHCLNHWAIKGLNGGYISYETLASTTEPSEASIDSTFHITETLTLTTEPSEASMNSTFHITETLVLTTEPSEASMESTFHITETLALTTEPSEVSMESHFIWDTRLNQWTIRGHQINESTIHITETLALTTEPSEASMESTIHITETLVLTTEPSEASMNSTFHIPETLALTNETWNVLYNLEVMGSIPYFS